MGLNDVPWYLQKGASITRPDSIDFADEYAMIERISESRSLLGDWGLFGFQRGVMDPSSDQSGLPA